MWCLCSSCFTCHALPMTMPRPWYQTTVIWQYNFKTITVNNVIDNHDERQWFWLMWQGYDISNNYKMIVYHKIIWTFNNIIDDHDERQWFWLRWQGYDYCMSIAMTMTMTIAMIMFTPWLCAWLLACLDAFHVQNITMMNDNGNGWCG